MWVGVFGGSSYCIRYIVIMCLAEDDDDNGPLSKKTPFILKSNVSDVLQMRNKHSHTTQARLHPKEERKKYAKIEEWKK